MLFDIISWDDDDGCGVVFVVAFEPEDDDDDKGSGIKLFNMSRLMISCIVLRRCKFFELLLLLLLLTIEDGLFDTTFNN